MWAYWRSTSHRHLKDTVGVFTVLPAGAAAWRTRAAAGSVMGISPGVDGMWRRVRWRIVAVGRDQRVARSCSTEDIVWGADLTLVEVVALTRRCQCPVELLGRRPGNVLTDYGRVPLFEAAR